MVDRRRKRERSRSRSRSPDRGDRKYGRKEDTVEEKLTKAQRTIFVGQLTSKVNEDKLEDFFNQVGTVDEVIMVRDKRTNKHKGFAYVEMSSLDAIPNCLLFNKSVPDFQKFEILVSVSDESTGAGSSSKAVPAPPLNPYAPAPPRAMPAPVGPQLKSRIYIGNICSSADSSSFTKVLEFYGPLESSEYHQVPTNTQKKYAFAKFASDVSAAAAVEALNGFVLGGSCLGVALADMDSNTDIAFVVQ